MPEASLTLWLAGALLLVLMVRGGIRGYRRGPMRQLAGPFSLALGCLLGAWFGPELGHQLLHGTSFPWLLRGAVGLLSLALVSGLLTYAACWRLGRLPEGQTEAESPLAGTVVGCWTGMLYFVLAVLGLATIAAVIELVAATERAGESAWVTTRNALAEAPGAGWLKGWTPLPERQNRIIRGVKKLLADPAARARLMAMPEIRSLAAHPSVYQAWEDRQVRELLNKKDLGGLIDHPRIRTILADEELQRQADRLDLPEIIERALQNPRK
ncbi:MAG: hypothetical protein RLZZ550_960 [Verrucomicrobiota bacterium]|jgi:hypothetical protein